MRLKKCYNCGFENHPDMEVCQKCGHNISGIFDKLNLSGSNMNKGSVISSEMTLEDLSSEEVDYSQEDLKNIINNALSKNPDIKINSQSRIINMSTKEANELVNRSYKNQYQSDPRIIETSRKNTRIIILAVGMAVILMGISMIAVLFVTQSQSKPSSSRSISIPSQTNINKVVSPSLVSSQNEVGIGKTSNNIDRKTNTVKKNYSGNIVFKFTFNRPLSAGEKITFAWCHENLDNIITSFDYTANGNENYVTYSQKMQGGNLKEGAYFCKLLSDNKLIGFQTIVVMK